MLDRERSATQTLETPAPELPLAIVEGASAGLSKVELGVTPQDPAELAAFDSPTRDLTLTNLEKVALEKMGQMLPESRADYDEAPRQYSMARCDLEEQHRNVFQEEWNYALNGLVAKGYLTSDGLGEHLPAEVHYDEIKERGQVEPMLATGYRAPDRWEDEDYAQSGQMRGARPVWEVGNKTFAGPSLVPEVIKPYGMKEEKQAKEVLEQIWHHAALVATGANATAFGNYHGVDNKGRHRVT